MLTKDLSQEADRVMRRAMKEMLQTLIQTLPVWLIFSDYEELEGGLRAGRRFRIGGGRVYLGELTAREDCERLHKALGYEPVFEREEEVEPDGDMDIYQFYVVQVTDENLDDCARRLAATIRRGA